MMDNNQEDIIRVSKRNLIQLNRLARNLELKPKNIRSQLSGHYLSPFKGRGMEFDEVRPYQPGDDIRSLDWRVMAKTTRPYTKLFREERERAVMLWLDLRRPMFFATQQAYKSVLASRAATLLGWSAVNHGDRIGAIIFSERQHIELRPKRGKSAVLSFIHLLEQHSAWQDDSHESSDTDTSAEQSLQRLRRVSRPGSLIFLLSDFRGFDQQSQRQLRELSKHNDVVMVYVHDVIEKALPKNGTYSVYDGNRQVAFHAHDSVFRQQYSRQFLQRFVGLKELANRSGVYFFPLCTADDLLLSMQTGLGLKPGR